MQIHQDIYKSLNYYKKHNNIPNILFHGENGCGKKTIVKNFVDSIYTSQDDRKKYVLVVDCIITNGIKFIREDLKFFAKSQINVKNGICFKTIILLNAGHLTYDAQSALRRCIEQFSVTTRFFIVIEDKTKLLKPLISRFSEMFIPLPYINNQCYNLYHYKKKENVALKNYTYKRYTWLKKYFEGNLTTPENITAQANCLINRGYTALEFDDFVKKNRSFNENKVIIVSLLYEKIRREIKSENLLLINYINNMFLRSNEHLENILDM